MSEEIVTIGDEKYIIKYRKSHEFMNDEESMAFRIAHGYDVVLKNALGYHFGERIPDAQFEDIPSNIPTTT